MFFLQFLQAAPSSFPTLQRSESLFFGAAPLSFRMERLSTPFGRGGGNTEALSGCWQARAMPGDGAKEESSSTLHLPTGERSGQKASSQAEQSQALPEPLL